MATTIKLKNSVTTTAAPASLVQGEVATNITDKKLWVGNAASSPVQLIGTGASVSFTTITTANDASISGLTVGKGGGSVATNTAVGSNSPLGSNTTGASSVAVGSYALNQNSTGNDNTVVGYGAGYYITGSNNTAVGRSALSTSSASTGGSNTAVGFYALQANTTASNNTAVGYQAGYANTTGSLTAIGMNSLYSNTTGVGNIAVGGVTPAVSNAALQSNTTGTYNIAMGSGALTANTTGSSNVGIGHAALISNTTASNNTAVGYQAGYSNTTGTQQTSLGYLAGYASTGNYCTFIGGQAGQATTGNNNTFLGQGSGAAITTGSKNTIIGIYGGNQGGLDIRTASNYIVLSDGDGNPRGVFDGSGYLLINETAATGTPATGVVIAPGSNAGGGAIYIGHKNGTGSTNSYATFAYNGGAIGSITQNGTTAVLYNTTSDYRLKSDVTPISNALATVEALNPVSFTWSDGRKDDGFLAHEIQAVIPNCVTGEKDAVNEDGTPKYQQMDSSGVIPFLVKAIQELKAEVDSLKQQLGK